MTAIVKTIETCRFGVSRLIVNADDFGLSESINRGIVAAHTEGIVTSTTWMAGGDQAKAAVELARASPQLEVGLHLTLTDVNPVSDAKGLESLLNDEGCLPSGYGPILQWMARSSCWKRAVVEEWRAQVLRFVSMWGRLPSHLDSHQHIALIPGLARRMVELAVDFEIPALRIPSEGRGLRLAWPPHAAHRPHETLLLRTLARQLRRHANRWNRRVSSSFAGFRQSGCMTEDTLLCLIPHLAAVGGSIELMVHPGDADIEGGYRRRQERDALTSHRVRDSLVAHRVQLARFSDLT